MAEASEMRPSPVGLPACGGAGPSVPDNKASVVQPFRAGSSADKTRAEALDYQEKPVEDLIFDAGKLHAQLADLLQIYLARAGCPDAIEQCSAKDAISCAKTLTAMMTDVQSGRPASVDKATEWPRFESSSVGPRRFHNAKSGNGGPRFGSAQHPELVEGRVAALQPESASIRTLEDAVSVVCMSDEETQILEPWARLVARIQKLCTETQKRLDEAPNRIGGANERRSENEDCVKDMKSRASEPGVLSTDIESESFRRVRSRLPAEVPQRGTKEGAAPSSNPADACPPSRAPRDRRDRRLMTDDCFT